MRIKMLLKNLLWLMILVLLVAALGAMKSAQGITPPQTWEEFLVMLYKPESLPVFIGALFSFLAKYTPYEQVPTKWKRLVFQLICFILPVLGVVLGMTIYGWPFSVELIWAAVSAALAAMGAGTLVHGYLPQKTPTGVKYVRGF